MTLYLDTSALAKLVVAEDATAALRWWLRERPDAPIVTNSVGVVELSRLSAPFVSYDHRMLDAANDYGLPTAAPR